MQEYPVKRGHVKKTDLLEIAKAYLDEASQDGEWVVGACGAVKSMKARYNGLTALEVDTEQDRQPDMATAQRTIKAWNGFLEAATGYNAKQRGKKAQEKAKKAG